MNPSITQSELKTGGCRRGLSSGTVRRCGQRRALSYGCHRHQFEHIHLHAILRIPLSIDFKAFIAKTPIVTSGLTNGHQNKRKIASTPETLRALRRLIEG